MRLERARRIESAAAPLLLACLFVSGARLSAHDTVVFDADVQPILSRSCGGGGCHINERTSGVEMTSYEALMGSVGVQYGTRVVVPGDPDASPILDKVGSGSPEFGAPMPLVGEVLSASEVGLLRQWIAGGALRSHLPQRGDANANDHRDVSDAVYVLDFLFRRGTPPSCPPQADINLDGGIDISDPVFLLLFLFAGGPEPPPISEAEAEACEAANELSFANIHEMVFSRSCAFSSCHSAESRKADLVLATPEAAYAGLVGADPFNEVARLAGLLRVDPRRPENSFLLNKLTEPGPGEGNRMPANSPVPLSETTVSLIREWILAGAPFEGTIDGVPAITEEPPPPINRLPQPPLPENGVQLHLPAYPVAARSERQLHYFIGQPFAGLPQEEIVVRRIDVHMMEESHHFILYRWIAASDPPAGYREGSFVDVEKLRLVVASQQSFFSLAFPDGVGIRFDKNERFDLNSHYINLSGQETLWGEVYINIFFADPATVRTEVKPIFDFGGTIHVPPYATTTASGTFPHGRSLDADPELGTVDGRVGRETHVYSLTSHTHRHGVRFAAWRTRQGVLGDMVYDNYSWDDPEFTVYDPPLILQPGEGIFYEATYTYHDPPSASAPPLSWGGDSEDEMVILLGYYAVP